MPNSHRENFQGRLEDTRFLQGRGTFCANQAASLDYCHCAFVRSPYPHARIVKIAIDEAQAMPGVKAVIDGAFLADHGINAMAAPEIPIGAKDAFFNPVPQFPLARDTVRFVGEAVVMVVAETLAQAQDCCEALIIEYEELPLLAHNDEETLVFHHEKGDEQATRRALENSAKTVSLTLDGYPISGAYLEPRTVICDYDSKDERVHVITTGQAALFMHSHLTHVCNCAAHEIHVTIPDVGGGFGLKFSTYPETACITAASRILQRSMQWQSTRTEAFLADFQARNQTATTTLGLDDGGNITALLVESTCDMGAYPTPNSGNVCGEGFAKTLGHCYRVPTLYCHTKTSYANMPPQDPLRGAGKPESTHLVERLIDLAARECAQDVISFRKQNLLHQHELPRLAANGYQYETGDFLAVLDSACALANYADFAARAKTAREKGKLRGIGVGMHLHLTGGAKQDTAQVRLETNGDFTVMVGQVPSGQGHETTLAELFAKKLEIQRERVTLCFGDSDVVHGRSGTGGSNAMAVSASALLEAADGIIERMKEMASDELEADIA
ncbi:MAG: xanthine dehydrogenase family protein molybdopterin-binding subunit, partial [Pseudomonadota bacterium]